MFKFNYDRATIIVAPAIEIKSIYKSICRAGCLKTGITPLYTDLPIFTSDNKICGIFIEDGYMFIINEIDIVLTIVERGMYRYLDELKKEGFYDN